MTTPVTPFSGPEHEPFDLAPAAVDAAPPTAALLLHGFMGTPKELRPLGEALAAAGVRARAPLLPGFGADMTSLNRISASDWSRAVAREWVDLRATAERSVLIGFSFGAALALAAAATAAPSRLVLISPYVRLIDLPAWLLTAGLPVLSRTVRTFAPYRNADFSDPEVRRFFSEMDPTLDLDDPATQGRLRQRSTIPFRVIDQLRRATDAGRKAAPSVDAPTLLVQGTRDETSTIARTRALAATLPGPLTLREIEADHLIVDRAKPSWPGLRDAVVGFVRDEPAGPAS